MTRFPTLLRCHAPIAMTLLAGMFCLSEMAYAQSASTLPAASAAPSGSDTIRLTDAERQAVMDKTTAESAAAARGEMTGADRAKLEVHGEVGAFVGSNGSRGIAGVAAVPLGDNAGAVVSFESSRFGYRR